MKHSYSNLKFKSDYMKTQQKRFLHVRGLRTLVMCAFGIMTFNQVDAQSKVGSGLVGSAQLVKENETPIVSFSPVYTSGKTFVRWLVQNDEKDGIFIVERSADGIDFEALGFKDRVGSPLCVNLFYSYIDETPLTGQTYYRIMSVGTDQTYSYSDVVRVRTDPSAVNPATNSASTETGE
jgi:hypothetical protein